LDNKTASLGVESLNGRDPVNPLAYLTAVTSASCLLAAVYFSLSAFLITPGTSYLRGMTDAMATAEKLLQAGSVKLRPSEPFTWASGWKSPIYCDNRKLLSLPFTRDFIKSELANAVFEKYPEAEVVAGVATAGIPWGAMVADQLKLPFAYVRPKPKEHGLGNQVEGEISSGQKVVVVEDLISTGKSSLQVVDVLRQQGVEVTGMVSIFSYQFDVAQDAFERAGVAYFSLTDYPTLIQLASQKGLIHAAEQDILLNWRADPANWKGAQ
jgi:orotate phosphoribosyltransferase